MVKEVEDEVGEECWGVVVEDADGEVLKTIEEGVNDVGGRIVVCPEAVGSIPVVEGVGRLAVTRLLGLPVGIVGAGAGVWRELAASEGGEVLALFRGGLGDGSDVHVGWIVEGVEEESMRVAEVMKRINWGAL